MKTTFYLNPIDFNKETLRVLAWTTEPYRCVLRVSVVNIGYFLITTQLKFKKK